MGKGKSRASKLGYGIVIARYTLALLLLLLVIFYLDYKSFWEYLSIDMLIASLAVQPILFLAYIPLAYRYKILTNDSSLRIKDIYAGIILSFGMNIVLPGRIAELLKIIYLRKYGNLSISHGIAALFVERLSDLFTVILLGLIGVNIFLFNINTRIFGVAVILIVLVIIALPYLELHLVKLIGKLPWENIKIFTHNVFTHAVSIIRDGKIYTSFSIGAITWAFWFLSVYLFLKMIGVNNLGLGGTLALFVATALGGAIPALPGGLGTFEAGAVFVLMKFGYTFEKSVAIGITLHFGQLLGVFIAALIISMKQGAGVRGMVSEIQKFIKNER